MSRRCQIFVTGCAANPLHVPELQHVQLTARRQDGSTAAEGREGLFLKKYKTGLCEAYCAKNTQTFLFGVRVRTFRWRICLPVLNLLLAVGMSALGWRQYDQIRHRFQGHGRMFYVPPAQLVSYSLNAPPFVLSNLLHHSFLGWRSLWEREWFYGVSTDFYVLLPLFWFWVGWQFDVPRSLTPNRYLNWFATMLSFALLCCGTYLCGEVWLHPDGWPVEKAIAASASLWGLVSFYFSGRRVLHIRGSRAASS